jgi:acyl-CoA thioester hydrolase
VASLGAANERQVVGRDVTTIRVRFHELDPYGHLNHGVYLSYFEQARVDLLERIGFGLQRLAQLGHHIVVVEVQVRFLAPAYAGDEVRITSTIRDLRRVSSTWHQEMLRGDEVIATNEVRAAMTDLKGRPTSPPAGLREALQVLAAGSGPGTTAAPGASTA